MSKLLLSALKTSGSSRILRRSYATYSLDGVKPVLPENDEYWIAPNAQVIGNVHMKRNASVWWGAVIRGDTDRIELGENVNVQDNSVLHTDEGIELVIGDDVTVGHQVMLHGCKIGEGSLIGIGSIILNDTTIGKGCLIGANTFIGERKTIPDYSVVMGAPGRVVKTMTPEQAAGLKEGAKHYVANFQRFKKGLVEL
ncbi:hypothetical protein SARC_00800 [Sphaeroforma arctica JP610]|uniref:Gamma carbonic anhydrase family protein n=1 Tax=Sphaeroforma arctica JP610 TaxID=667725 RepID=A0A0L0GDU2_9EUKA|nr:hypothetical protein SARC_00800 [Sphaeroforma arctica JP610]KNC87056.1 hypothetical protein SARC_00800 [Sphaeroforma arctica JP610]|eukprot:XP_014160958.1 hypothetical protein SARC_00800 [Sphaeroforma arctica JP610]